MAPRVTAGPAAGRNVVVSLTVWARLRCGLVVLRDERVQPRALGALRRVRDREVGGVGPAGHDDVPAPSTATALATSPPVPPRNTELSRPVPSAFTRVTKAYMAPWRPAAVVCGKSADWVEPTTTGAPSAPTATAMPSSRVPPPR